jgi:hypothetical protein
MQNIFYDSGKSIYFSHKDNMAEGNFYAMPPESDRERGLNWMLGYEIIRVDLSAWQKYYGYDKYGKEGTCTIDVDLDALTLSISSVDDIPDIDSHKIYKSDFVNKGFGNQRFAGPFNNLEGGRIIDINPLKQPTY